MTGTANVSIPDDLVVEPSDIISHRSQRPSPRPPAPPWTPPCAATASRRWSERRLDQHRPARRRRPRRSRSATASCWSRTAPPRYLGDPPDGSPHSTSRCWRPSPTWRRGHSLAAGVAPHPAPSKLIGRITRDRETIHGKREPGGCMRAARCEEYGGPENRRHPRHPQPGGHPGHVLVDVSAAAVNYPDLLFIANRYQASALLPFTPGSEFSGLGGPGEGVTEVSPGDLVYGFGFTAHGRAGAGAGPRGPAGSAGHGADRGGRVPGGRT